jgi:lipoprotein-anchoring transpeptidase ErfK/SrfK
MEIVAPRIWISLAEQRLYLLAGEQVVVDYPVSTARNGPGEINGSGCTPRGLHRIRLKIGAGAPVNTVFVGRRPTGEIYNPDLGARFPERDWILTRILWLSGLEPGHNRCGARDTLRRFIYIHGCPAELPLGIPLSHGCIRMANDAIIDLFAQVQVGDNVLIEEAAFAAARPEATAA